MSVAENATTCPYSTEALLYYVAVYAVTTITACACFSILSGENDSLDNLDGAFKTHPLASILLSLSVLSLAGIPPLPGFLGKFFIFKTVIASGHVVSAVIAFVGSYIGAFFYLGIVLRLFRGEQAVEQPRATCQAGTWGDSPGKCNPGRVHGRAGCLSLGYDGDVKS